MNRTQQKDQCSTEIVRLSSKLNAVELPYCAILPAGYEASTGKHGVLYLLHGLFGRFDNWMTNTGLTALAADFPFIIICPEAGDGWYTDSPHIENHFFESYLTRELIPDVERRFKVRAERNSRFVAGLSMGGYGAFKLAFRQPDTFCAAAAMSGAFHAAEISVNPKSAEWAELEPSISKVFGADIEQETRQKNDLFQMAGSFPSAQINQLPYFYFDCGADDSFLPVNVRLAELFRKRGIAHEFHRCPGGHDWDYWNARLIQILEIAKKYLTPPDK